MLSEAVTRSDEVSEVTGRDEVSEVITKLQQWFKR